MQTLTETNQKLSKSLQTLRQSCDEAIDNSQPVQVPAAFAPGDMLPQGDIGLVMLERLPTKARPNSWPEEGDLQLAPGNSKGSRHCIPRQYKESVALYTIQDGDPLSDMIVEATSPFDLTHPEHADHNGYPAGIYRVHHQQNEQRMRVID